MLEGDVSPGHGSGGRGKGKVTHKRRGRIRKLDRINYVQCVLLRIRISIRFQNIFARVFLLGLRIIASPRAV